MIEKAPTMERVGVIFAIFALGAKYTFQDNKGHFNMKSEVEKLFSPLNQTLQFYNEKGCIMTYINGYRCYFEEYINEDWYKKLVK